MWCLGYSRLSFGPLLIGLNISWYISSRGTASEIRSGIYLPGLHHNVVAFSVDAVFIVVGDQATAIEHFIQTENSSLFQRWMQSWSIQLPKCWLLWVKSAKSRLSWSQLGFVVKFIGDLKLIGNYPCLHTKRRQHGCPAKSLTTNHRDFSYLNKFFNLCLLWQRRQKCLLTPTNITIGNQRWHPQASMGWQVFHEPRINPQAHGVPP